MTAPFTPALGHAAMSGLCVRAIVMLTRMQFWRSRLVDQVAPGAGGTVIDPGCGTGSLAVTMAQRVPGARRISLAPDRAILWRARVSVLSSAMHAMWPRSWATGSPTRSCPGGSSWVFHGKKEAGLGGGPADAQTRRATPHLDRFVLHLSRGSSAGGRGMSGGATIGRLMSRRTVLWSTMGLSSARHGWMTALLASFLALFVLISAAEAATCAPEAATAHASERLADSSVDPDSDDNDRPDQRAICAHGHCHHSSSATSQTPEALTLTTNGRDPALPSIDRLASRKPTGPDRPPRG
ncbi:hypothetical protein [Brevundimonas sp.]|uniref:hypothetical protein n=1 Tax=Brevundimonas sp. TaxID=1871086 RepID=UPI002486E82C|nr:hypothetical protein [Brevundimonas sp.]MDI1280004.1 hypothetical protein [Brevundimonas sp.]